MSKNKRTGQSGGAPATPKAKPGEQDLKSMVESMMNEKMRSLYEKINEQYMEIDYLKTVVMTQNTKISNLERELDDLDQYNRRENVTFSNVSVPEGSDSRNVVKDICQEIGVTIKEADFVDAHPLPARRGRPTKIIARFHERSKAREIFKARKRCKDLSSNLKQTVCAKPEKSISINPNLTVGKAKLLDQVRTFNDEFGYRGAWADPNTGKILLKTSNDRRANVIRDTSDLILINQKFKPAVSDYVFCTPPLFCRKSIDESDDF